MIDEYVEVVEKLNRTTLWQKKFILYVIKLNFEIELNCLKQSKNTFEIIKEYEKPVEDVWSILIRAAFMLGEMDELCLLYNKWKNSLNMDLKDDYSFLFFQYYKYKEYGDNEEISVETFKSREDLSNEVKSIVCFLLSLKSNSRSQKVKYLQMANICCKNNYSVVVELLKLGYMPYKVEIEDILCNNMDNLKYIRLKKTTNLQKYNEEDEISFCVIGGGNTVGGSCYLLKINGINVMIDCGVQFARDGELIYPDFSILKNFGLKGVEDLDMLIITHAHLDHSGGIIELYKKRQDLPIYMTSQTKELLRKNLNPQDEERYYLEHCLKSAIIINFREEFIFKKDSEKVNIQLFRAGHILGAASVFIKGREKSLFITGDYSLKEQRTVKAMDVPKDFNIDILITENTYGNFSNINPYPRDIEEKLFIKDIVSHIERGYKTLIPAFALGRAQEVICLLKEYFSTKENIPFRIYIDGLVTDICKIYSEYTDEDFQGRGIFFANDNQGYRTKEEFIDKEAMYHNCCVICSSGMLKDGSASSYYAEKFLEKENALCILTGYQDEESPGNKLREQFSREGDKYIILNYNVHKIRSKLSEYYLSAHCQFEEIINLVFKISPKKVLLVHGQADKQRPSELYSRLTTVEGLEVIQTFNKQMYNL